MSSENEPKSSLKEEFLTICSRGNSLELLNILQHYSEINFLREAQTSTGDSALHLAVQNGQYEIVSILLQYGFNPNVENEQHKTPIMFAIRDQNTAMICQLVENGAQVPNMGNIPPFYMGFEDVVTKQIPLWWAFSH